MNHTSGQPMEVRATATPAGVATVIQADAYADLVRAQAECMANPASCGWFAGYGYTPFNQATAATNAWYLQYLGLYQAAQATGANTVLLNQTLLDLGAAQRDLEQSRRDFAEAIGDSGAPPSP
jgi:hypothetical protein